MNTIYARYTQYKQNTHKIRNSQIVLQHIHNVLHNIRNIQNASQKIE